MLRQLLCDLIQKEPSLINDHRRLEAMLKDLCPQDQRLHMNAVLIAQRNMIPHRWKEACFGTQHSKQYSLAKYLYEEIGLREDLAQWVVETWALALMPNLIFEARSGNDVQQSKDLLGVFQCGNLTDIPPIEAVSMDIGRNEINHGQDQNQEAPNIIDKKYNFFLQRM